jgi:hypothetical protein
LAQAKAFCFVRYVSAVLVCCLAACTDSSTGLLATVRDAFGPTHGVIDSAKLDPRYRYLRVVHPGGVSGMIFAGVETTSRGQVEIWYASDGEILRLQNGRLAGNSGLKPEWRNVVLPPLPSWSVLATLGESLKWARVRDVMPGYRYGVQDRLLLVLVPPPRSSRLVGVDPKELVWFEERTESSTEAVLPPSRYAVKDDRVVYAEQCIAPHRCFTWQRWPAGS